MQRQEQDLTFKLRICKLHSLYDIIAMYKNLKVNFGSDIEWLYGNFT